MYLMFLHTLFIKIVDYLYTILISSVLDKKCRKHSSYPLVRRDNYIPEHTVSEMRTLPTYKHNKVPAEPTLNLTSL